LVDLSAPKILGKFLINKEKKIIYSLSKSENIWEKRIAIVSTYSLIKENKFEDTLEISKILLQDAQDLIQKAVGWMLREVGKRNIKELKKFLEENKEKMSRTTLRYSIEKFNEKERKKYLSKYDK
jgi:3-methyladenine DNA glycosylase AlkD